MKKAYRAPTLIEYGSLDQLTLGTSTPLPDIDQNGNATGTGCATTSGSAFTRTSCTVVTS